MIYIFKCKLIFSNTNASEKVLSANLILCQTKFHMLADLYRL